MKSRMLGIVLILAWSLGASAQEVPAEPGAGQEEPAGIGQASEGDFSASLREVAQRRFLQLIDERRYAEAVPVARRIVELTIDAFGDDSIELVAPLDNLATAQMLNGDLVDAENNYRRSVQLIELREGILSKRLINPLIGLGATYNRSGLYEEGAEAFARALRISHVNEGFYNFEQFKIRDGLTESQIGLQDIEEANFHQQIQVEIHQRKLGIDNPEVVPAMYKLARWYQRAGNPELARATYQMARRMLKSARGKQDPSLVDALVGISSTYERQGLMSEAASSLKKAIEIIDTQTEPDYLRRADLLIKLGDVYGSFGKSDSAEVRYREAWQDLSRDEAFVDKLDEYFAEPERIAGLPFSALKYAERGLGKRDEPRLSKGYVLVSYSVTAQGRTDDIRVIESEPAGLMDQRVVSSLQRSYFRPRRDDNVAVTSEGQLHRQEFFYAGVTTEQKADDGNGALEYPDGADKKTASGKLDYPPPPADN